MFCIKFAALGKSAPMHDPCLGLGSGVYTTTKYFEDIYQHGVSVLVTEYYIHTNIYSNGQRMNRLSFLCVPY